LEMRNLDLGKMVLKNGEGRVWILLVWNEGVDEGFKKSVGGSKKWSLNRVSARKKALSWIEEIHLLYFLWGESQIEIEEELRVKSK